MKAHIGGGWCITNDPSGCNWLCAILASGLPRTAYSGVVCHRIEHCQGCIRGLWCNESSCGSKRQRVEHSPVGSPIQCDEGLRNPGSCIGGHIRVHPVSVLRNALQTIGVLSLPWSHSRMFRSRSYLSTHAIASNRYRSLCTFAETARVKSLGCGYIGWASQANSCGDVPGAFAALPGFRIGAILP